MDNTQQSIKGRLIFVAVVLASWAYSIFPLENQDYFAFVEKTANASISSKSISADAYKTLEENLKKARKAVDAQNIKATRKVYNDALRAFNTVISDGEAKAFKAAFEKAKSDYKNKVKKNAEAIAPMTRQDALLNACLPSAALLSQARSSQERDDIIRRHSIHLYKFLDNRSGTSNNKDVAKYVQNSIKGKIKSGIDLKGGVQFTMEFSPDDPGIGENDIEQIRDTVIEILRRRIDGKGLAEIEIRPFSKSSISITVPSVNEDEVAAIRSLLMRQAKLTFREANPRDGSGTNFPHSDPYSPDVRLGDVEMEGDDIENATAVRDEKGRWIISKKFNIEGAKEFGRITTKYSKLGTGSKSGQRLAIVLDDVVYSVLGIDEPIMGGRAQITGSFTKEEAEELSLILRSGAMPVKLSFAGESRTDPSLGAAAVKSGIMSCIVGLILVLIFMLFYYRKAGAIAVLALVANILLVIGSMAILGGTFTLPGIAGIILTIGMAVDTNVLIFERIREELATGKTLFNSTREGFSRAFVTIFDANITTLLTALILMKFGSGPIQGFAYTLAIGIVASMFTGIFMSRIFFDMMSRDHSIKELAGFAAKPARTTDFWSMRKNAMMFSIALIALAIGTIVYRNSDALSVDLAGGNSLTYELKKGDANKEVIEKALDAAKFKNARVDIKQGLNANTKSLEVIVKENYKTFKGYEKDENPTRFYAHIDSVVRGKNSSEDWVKQGQQSVGGVVGAEFRSQALLAIILSLIGIFIYVMLRFEAIFAVGAIAALGHDTLIALGIYLLLGYQISLPVIAAVLTIIGYSLNDTIVVFDRIRENSADIKKKKSFDIMNISINGTLSRTILTSVTTLLVVLILVVFGGGAIADFAVVLLIGILIGTYSSIFVASPIVCNKLESHLVKIHEDKEEREMKRKNDQSVMVD